MADPIQNNPNQRVDCCLSYLKMKYKPRRNSTRAIARRIEPISMVLLVVVSAGYRALVSPGCFVHILASPAL
jgi:hypothetical protein